MPYRFRRSETMAEAAHRILIEEIDAAIVAGRDADDTLAERVHRIRTSCKKARGLGRLVRSGLSESYHSLNVFFRDTARSLAGFRDAAVVIDTFDAIHRDGQADRAAVRSLRDRLADRMVPIVEMRVQQALAEAVAAMRQYRDVVPGFVIAGKGLRVVGEGLADTYQRARIDMHGAFETTDPAVWHEWRKRVKYHWYHIRLLRNVWKPVMDARRGELDRLADLLGEDHDLAVLAAAIGSLELDEAGTATTTLSRIDERQNKLRATARPLGGRLFAEQVDAFTDRMRRYWKIWHTE